MTGPAVCTRPAAETAIAASTTRPRTFLVPATLALARLNVFADVKAYTGAPADTAEVSLFCMPPIMLPVALKIETCCEITSILVDIADTFRLILPTSLSKLVTLALTAAAAAEAAAAALAAALAMEATEVSDAETLVT